MVKFVSNKNFPGRGRHRAQMADRLVIIATGGTISMTGGSAGLMPSRSAHDLLGALGVCGSEVTIGTHDLFCMPSASLDFEAVQDLCAAIEKAEAEGADGVIITQGSDTMEEVAFAVELICAALIPVIFTGAMRAPSQPGYDGLRNLSDAVIAARHLRGRCGVFIVMNGQVHSARRVSKGHTACLEAFSSPAGGPLMSVHEGRIIEHAHESIVRAGLRPAVAAADWPAVGLLMCGVGDDGRLLGLLPEAGFGGCVLAAAGGGHVSGALAERIGALAQRMPVVLASRIASGPVYESTYGYPGSERDLIARGVIPSYWLGALRARILLTLCLAAVPATARVRFRELAALLSGVSG